MCEEVPSAAAVTPAAQADSPRSAGLHHLLLAGRAAHVPERRPLAAAAPAAEAAAGGAGGARSGRGAAGGAGGAGGAGAGPRGCSIRGRRGLDSGLRGRRRRGRQQQRHGSSGPPAGGGFPAGLAARGHRPRAAPRPAPGRRRAAARLASGAAGRCAGPAAGRRQLSARPGTAGGGRAQRPAAGAAAGAARLLRRRCAACRCLAGGLRWRAERGGVWLDMGCRWGPSQPSPSACSVSPGTLASPHTTLLRPTPCPGLHLHRLVDRRGTPLGLLARLLDRGAAVMEREPGTDAPLLHRVGDPAGGRAGGRFGPAVQACWRWSWSAHLVSRGRGTRPPAAHARCQWACPCPSTSQAADEADLAPRPPALHRRQPCLLPPNAGRRGGRPAHAGAAAGARRRPGGGGQGRQQRPARGGGAEGAGGRGAQRAPGCGWRGELHRTSACCARGQAAPTQGIPWPLAPNSPACMCTHRPLCTRRACRTPLWWRGCTRRHPRCASAAGRRLRWPGPLPCAPAALPWQGPRHSLATHTCSPFPSHPQPRQLLTRRNREFFLPSDRAPAGSAVEAQLEALTRREQDAAAVAEEAERWERVRCDGSGG